MNRLNENNNNIKFNIKTYKYVRTRLNSQCLRNQVATTGKASLRAAEAADEEDNDVVGANKLLQKSIDYLLDELELTNNQKI